jgi:glycosyltransferase involved in cell wall biosynthesis
LWYLSETPCDFILPVGQRPNHGYGGRGTTFPFGGNVIDCPLEDLQSQRFDCILFQSRGHYEVDQHELLSPAQRQLPRIYLEHDPPWEDVTDQRHWFDDPQGLLVHVTHFNRLMWDSGRTPMRVIEHGVRVPASVRYTGELARGITAMNHLLNRGRKVGADIFQEMARHTPLDLIGMDAERAGGIGEIAPPELPSFIAKYRYFFSPIRYTSLGLAILEAMSVGLPIVGLATCELATVIENGRTGFLETDTARLLEHMQRLVRDPKEAHELGRAASKLAAERFNIRRFADDWYRTLWEVAGDSIARGASATEAAKKTRPTNSQREEAAI